MTRTCWVTIIIMIRRKLSTIVGWPNEWPGGDGHLSLQRIWGHGASLSAAQSISSSEHCAKLCCGQIQCNANTLHIAKLCWIEQLFWASTSFWTTLHIAQSISSFKHCAKLYSTFAASQWTKLNHIAYCTWWGAHGLSVQTSGSEGQKDNVKRASSWKLGPREDGRLLVLLYLHD